MRQHYKKGDEDMRKYYGVGENYDDVYYIGETAEIKAMYKSIARNRNTNIRPLYGDAPKFSPYNQVYGILIDKDGWMSVITSDVFAWMLVSGDITEIKPYWLAETVSDDRQPEINHPALMMAGSKSGVQAKQHYNEKRKRWEEMELSKELSDKIKYDLPAEVVEMRFELFDWLKEKGLSVRQATELLAMTRGEIIEARRKEMNDMKL